MGTTYRDKWTGKTYTTKGEFVVYVRVGDTSRWVFHSEWRALEDVHAVQEELAGKGRESCFFEGYQGAEITKW